MWVSIWRQLSTRNIGGGWGGVFPCLKSVFFKYCCNCFIESCLWFSLPVQSEIIIPPLKPPPHYILLCRPRGYVRMIRVSHRNYALWAWLPVLWKANAGCENKNNSDNKKFDAMMRGSMDQQKENIAAGIDWPL